MLLRQLLRGISWEEFAALPDLPVCISFNKPDCILDDMFNVTITGVMLYFCKRRSQYKCKQLEQKFKKLHFLEKKMHFGCYMLK